MDLTTIMQGLTLATVVGVFTRILSLESRLSHLEGYMRARDHQTQEAPR